SVRGVFAQAEKTAPGWAASQRAERVTMSSGEIATQFSRAPRDALRAQNGACATSTVRRAARLGLSGAALRTPISTSRWAMSSLASVVLKAMRKGSSGPHSREKLSAKKFAVHVPAEIRTTE